MFLEEECYNLESDYIKDLDIYKQSKNKVVKESLLRLSSISNKVMKPRIKQFLTSFNDYKVLTQTESVFNYYGYVSTTDYFVSKPSQSRIIEGGYNVGGVTLCHCEITVNKNGCVNILKLMIDGVCNNGSLPARVNREELIIDNDHVKFADNGISASSSVGDVEEEIDDSEKQPS